MKIGKVFSLVYLLILLIITGCTNQQAEIKASEENLTFDHTFEYDDQGAYWVGRVQNNLEDSLIKPFELELYLTFKDGKEYLAYTKQVEAMNPKEIIELNEDITEVYKDNGYTANDGKSFRIEIIAD